ncbi:hypothetical protein RHSIM_Rhsim02G0017200 [Rhododendron simsii]|uniref:Protein FAR1-RELATED SEQUENCE n=1 Tax=Rhododendron simsii TaxID=118357 RepID=A0A834H9S4_RHOSS|nr:hypothetical protein RHSIM_Rhsim02G0017200 [Rhododendron simsii]
MGNLQPFRFHLVISFVAMVVILVGGSGRWGRGFGGMIGDGFPFGANPDGLVNTAEAFRIFYPVHDQPVQYSDMNREEFGNIMTVRAKPTGTLLVKNNGHREDEGESKLEPQVGLEFDSAEDAQEFYNLYATQVGFRIRIGQLYRSRVDGTVISRRFVCSKEGFQTNSRTGCPAFIRVQKSDSGKWVLANIKVEHNHELGLPGEIRPPHIQRKALPAPRSSIAVSTRTGIRSLEEEDGRPSPSGAIDVKRLKTEEAEEIPKVEPCKGLEFGSANEAYKFYFAYAASFGFKVRIGQLFRSKHDGSITSRRFVCSKEGHQHPSRVGCGAFLRIQRQDTGRWVVDRLQKEHNHDLDSPMDASRLIAAPPKGFKEEVSSGLENLDLVETNGGFNLVKIVRQTDQDKAIQQSIAQVFPGTHHRFSTWQIKAKEQQYLGAFLSMDAGFKYEYEACICQSQTPNEFDSAWNVLLNKYDLNENAWLKEMYRTRKSWVPLYIRSTFFAGIPIDGSMKSFFGTFLNSHTPLNEFVLRYEKAVEQRREEERKEDFNSFNLQVVLHTKDPIEDQGRRLYTVTMFKTFQKELLDCYGYVGIKINVEGVISRYLVQKCGNGGDERNTVAFNTSNQNVSCSCKMFEFEGVLCRHALKVFQIMNKTELPSRYILHRWTKSAKYGILRDVDSGGGSQDFRALMLWTLREEARNYIEAGAASIERYKLAFEIMQEGRRNLCWQN